MLASRRLALAVLLAFARSAAAQDGGVAPDAEAPPAGVPDAGVPTDAPDAGPPPDPREVELATLEADVASLERLLEGDLPGDVEVTSLFEVDFGSAEAVAARVAALEAALAAPSPPPEPEAADAGVPAEDAGTEPGTAGTEPEDAGTEPEDAEPAEDPELPADAPGTEALAPGAVLPGPSEAERAALDARLASLRRERDALRLRFLSLPVERRSNIVRAVDERRTLAVAALENEAARRAAEEAGAEAEARRREALAEAAAARNVAERALLAERARIEDALRRIAALDASLAADRSAGTEAATRSLELEHEANELLAAAGSGDADGLYLRIVDALRMSRDAFSDALGELRAPSRVEALEPGVELEDGVYAELGEPREAVLQALSDYATRAAEVRAHERDDRWNEAEALAVRVRALYDARLAILPRLTPGRRDAVLGVGPEGLQQLRRELRQAQLMARWERERVVHDADLVPARLARWLGAAGTRRLFLTALGVLVALVLLWRSRQRLATLVVSTLRREQRSSRVAAFLAPWARSVGAVLEPALTFGLATLFFSVARELGEPVLLLVLERVVLLVTGYRVLNVALAELLTSRLRAGESREAMRPRIRRDLAIVLGFVVLTAILQDVVALLVGRGNLYGIVGTGRWLLALPIGLWMLRRWGATIRRAYREQHPEGPLVPLLGDERRGVVPFLALAPAAGRLALGGVRAILEEGALRFEGSRRAVAYFSRRRLEQRVESSGHFIVDEATRRTVEAPEALATNQRVPHFPGLDDARRSLEAFAEGGAGASIAVVAERGGGKSTWVSELFRGAAVTPEQHAVPHELRGESATCAWLARALELGTDVVDVETLCTALAPSEPRAVVLEDGQNLILRSVGGTAATRALIDVIGRTSDRIFWVVTFSRLAWRYAQRLRQGEEYFAQVVELGGWTEDGIALLVRRRVAALERRLSFASLVVGRLEGTAFENAVVRSEQEFFRLLWDYSDGNPSVALHFFLHAIGRVEGESFELRLFDAPDPGELENLHERSRFVLAALALHESLTIPEAALVTTFPRSEVAATMALLRRRGVVREAPDGAHHISLHWFRAATRFLRRKRLLFN